MQFVNLVSACISFTSYQRICSFPSRKKKVVSMMYVVTRNLLISLEQQLVWGVPQNFQGQKQEGKTVAVSAMKCKLTHYFTGMLFLPHKVSMRNEYLCMMAIPSPRFTLCPFHAHTTCPLSNFRNNLFKGFVANNL